MERTKRIPVKLIAMLSIVILGFILAVTVMYTPNIAQASTTESSLEERLENELIAESGIAAEVWSIWITQ